MAELEFRILGPLEVRRDGAVVAIGSRRQRELLTLLLLQPNTVVAADDLIEQLWHPLVPPAAKASLQNHVARLRRLIGDHAVETVPPGYRANVTSGTLDLLRVEALLAGAQSQETEQRAATLREALACWDGVALLEAASPFAQSELVRLEELRIFALEERIETDLELARFSSLVPELEALVERHPLRERLWRQLMLALYGAGRQAEALATYRRAHRALVGELGIEPGQALKDLQRAILLQEPHLAVRDAATDDLFRRAAPHLPVADDDRARALLQYAQAIWQLGERRRADLALDDALRWAELSGNETLIQRVRLERTLNETLARAGNLVEQAELAARTSTRFEAIGELDALADSLLQQGYMLRDSGNATQSAALAKRAAAIATEAGNDELRRRAAGYLAVALAIGPTPVADALAQCPTTEHPTYGVLCGRGWLLVQSGETMQGFELLQRGIDIARSLGRPSALGGAHHWSAFAHETTGDAERVHAHLSTAYDLADSVTELGGVASAASRLAYILAVLGRSEEATEYADEAQSLSERSDFSVGVYTKLARALIAHARHDSRKATGFFEQAILAADRSDWLNLRALTRETAANVSNEHTLAQEAKRLYRRKGNRTALARLK
jgi:DNA-binding SARP family transcriptional activator